MQTRVFEQKCAKADNFFCSKLKTQSRHSIGNLQWELMEKETCDHHNIVGHFVEQYFVHKIWFIGIKRTTEEICQLYLTAE